ncbi:glycosyltransferase [Anaerobiospirillum thomasii]|uniref:Glycosyl transferase family 8 n=1 Tax=Anaerobiospirillum thomasii TaxID=179995 RepID=A0A2X0VT08_9GAMM|nr:glycosyltransferase [Anaerobiospirillum thomasii]SPT70870.1 Glycosyl transferase family 8 [Anaerobiospirillum thomasii]
MSYDIDLNTVSLDKKEFALFLICRGDFIFPLATTILSLLDSTPSFNDDIIIATGGDKYFNPHYKNILKEIYPNIVFTEYTDEFISNSLQKTNLVTNRILTLYSRYFAFDFLDVYRQILILDTDILVNNDISQFKELYGCGFAARKTTITLDNRFMSQLRHDILDFKKLYVLNTGVLYIDDTIPIRSQQLLANHQLYSSLKTKEKTKAGMEENIICISLYEYSTHFTDLSYLYHSYPTTADCDSAIIIHTKELAKFWNSAILNFAFPKWNIYFNQWKNIISKEANKGKLSISDIPKINLSNEYFNFPLESWKIISIFSREQRWQKFWKNVNLYCSYIYPIDISNRLKQRSFFIKELNLGLTVTISSPKSFTFIFKNDLDDYDLKRLFMSLQKSFKGVANADTVQFTIQDEKLENIFREINRFISTL